MKFIQLCLILSSIFIFSSRLYLISEAQSPEPSILQFGPPLFDKENEYGSFNLSQQGYGVMNTGLDPEWKSSCYDAPVYTLYHAGEDWWNKTVKSNTSGTSVKAIANGEIVWSGLTRYPGSVMLIKHRDSIIGEFYSMYGHIILSEQVAVGDEVQRGQVIGSIIYQGSQGVDNSHLHWETRNFFDPKSVDHPCPVDKAGNGYTKPPKHPDDFGYFNPSTLFEGRRIIPQPIIEEPSEQQPASDTFEPNDSTDTAYNIRSGTTYQSQIRDNSDIDVYRIYVAASSDDRKSFAFTFTGTYINDFYEIVIRKPNDSHLDTRLFVDTSGGTGFVVDGNTAGVIEIEISSDGATTSAGDYSFTVFLNDVPTLTQ